MQAIENYLAIQRIRFEEKLAVTVLVDPALHEFVLPCLLVHPLVENAVKYGMETSAAPLQVEIEVTARGSDLRIRVDDERLARRELSFLLQSHPEIEMAAEAGSVKEAVKAVESLHPDLLFLDIQMPRESGFDLFERTPVTAEDLRLVARRSHSQVIADERGRSFKCGRRARRCAGGCR